MRRLTRRQAIVGGTLVTAVGFVHWGRFAVGGTFEDHVADVLGVDGALAREMLERVRGHPDFDYEARASAFLLATTEPSRSVMPSGLRREIIEGFLTPLFVAAHEPSLALAFAGLRPTSAFTPCNVLVQA